MYNHFRSQNLHIFLQLQPEQLPFFTFNVYNFCSPRHGGEGRSGVISRYRGPALSPLHFHHILMTKWVETSTMNILGNTPYTAQRDLLGEIVVWVLIRLAKSIPHSAAGTRCKIPSYAPSYTLP